MTIAIWDLLVALFAIVILSGLILYIRAKLSG